MGDIKPWNAEDCGGLVAGFRIDMSIGGSDVKTMFQRKFEKTGEWKKKFWAQVPGWFRKIGKQLGGYTKKNWIKRHLVAVGMGIELAIGLSDDRVRELRSNREHFERWYHTCWRKLGEWCGEHRTHVRADVPEAE